MQAHAKAAADASQVAQRFADEEKIKLQTAEQQAHVAMTTFASACASCEDLMHAPRLRKACETPCTTRSSWHSRKACETSCTTGSSWHSRSACETPSSTG